MTDDDKFFERLREDAKQLRYEPADDAVFTRLAARVQERVAAQPSTAQLLARWFRPMAASLAALTLIAALSVQWIEQSHEPLTVEGMVAGGAPAEFGDPFLVE